MNFDGEKKRRPSVWIREPERIVRVCVCVCVCECVCVCVYFFNKMPAFVCVLFQQEARLCVCVCIFNKALAFSVQGDKNRLIHGLSGRERERERVCVCVPVCV